MLMPRSAIAAAMVSEGLTRLARTVLNAVPACEPLMPAMDIAEIAVVTSSMDSPMDCATGAMYLYDSPRSVMPIVPEFAAWVIRSATRDESAAARPKPVIASATIVATEPRLSPDAAVASRTPAIPSRICSVVQPAFAISVIASATSPEENAVSAPSSMAFSRRRSKSSPVAPVIACTCDMPFSKSVATLSPATPRAVTPALSGMSLLPTPSMALPAVCSLPPTSSILARVALVVAACFSRFFNASSVSMISRWSASY